MELLYEQSNKKGVSSTKSIERLKEKEKKDLCSYKKITKRLRKVYKKTKEKVLNYLMSLRYVYEKTNLMKTPCNHIFHSKCLEIWIDLKTECPYCRREIPQIE